MSAGLDRMMTTVKRAMELKQRMLERQLTQAKATCPHCRKKDSLRLAVAGPKKHLRMHCTTPGCNTMMME